MKTYKKLVPLFTMAACLFFVHEGLALDGNKGTILVENREPFGVQIQDIIWKDCGDNHNEYVGAGQTWRQDWNPVLNYGCQLDLIRISIGDQYNYVYQNKYNSEGMQEGGGIKCIIDRNRSRQPEDIMCYRVDIDYQRQVTETLLTPTGHF